MSRPTLPASATPPAYPWLGQIEEENGGVANQHTSELVGIERPWAAAVVSGRDTDVAELLTPHASKAKRRTIMAWLHQGAPYDYATPASISDWRRVLAAAGDPPGPLRTRRVLQSADKRSSLVAPPVAA